MKHGKSLLSIWMYYWKGPSRWERIVCDDHFIPADYDNYLRWSMGITPKLFLKNSSVSRQYPTGTSSTISRDEKLTNKKPAESTSETRTHTGELHVLIFILLPVNIKLCNWK